MTPHNASGTQRRRTAVVVVLGVVVLLLFIALGSQTAFNLSPILRPETSEQTLLFAALSALIFLVFIALTFVLGRNLFKLYAERRIGVLGSKFRTRMVVGALLLSFLPVIFLFQFAYLLMNRSIEKWFSGPVEELREESGRVATMMARYAAENARTEAESIANSGEVERAFSGTGSYAGVLAEFHRHEKTLQGGFAVATVDDDAVASLGLPEPWGVMRSKLPAAAEAHGKQLPAFMLANKEYVLGTATREGGRIIVAIPLPAQFSSTLSEIEQTQRRYY